MRLSFSWPANIHHQRTRAHSFQEQLCLFEEEKLKKTSLLFLPHSSIILALVIYPRYIGVSQAHIYPFDWVNFFKFQLLLFQVSSVQLLCRAYEYDFSPLSSFLPQCRYPNFFVTYKVKSFGFPTRLCHHIDTLALYQINEKFFSGCHHSYLPQSFNFVLGALLNTGIQHSSRLNVPALIKPPGRKNN